MVELRPFSRDDFGTLMGWVTTPAEVVQWAGFGFVYPLDRPQLERYLRVAEESADTRTIWKAVDAAAGETVGHIELDRIHHGARRARLSRVIVSPTHRGRGVARRMTLLAMEHGFETLGLHRIDLGVFDFNGTAIRCYESCGFVREGVERDAIRVGDVYWNAVQMSILEHEWRALPKAVRTGHDAGA